MWGILGGKEFTEDGATGEFDYTSSNQFRHEVVKVSIRFERWQSSFGSASSSVLEFVV
jgi:hypothetical protein